MVGKGDMGAREKNGEEGGQREKERVIGARERIERKEDSGG